MLLEKSLEEAPVVNRNGYWYFIHPITDGVPELPPELLREVVYRIVRALDNTDFDKIVCVEAMGIHLGALLSDVLDRPLVIVRKREYGLDGEVEITQEKGYGVEKLYLNGVSEGDRVVVVDDVISTGGTLVGLLNALDDVGAEVEDVVVVVARGGLERVKEETGIDVKYLVRVEVSEDGVSVVESRYR
ncbi:hypoxanthine/guanine phosphoribosyltransferase [Methanopyrus sp.]